MDVLNQAELDSLLGAVGGPDNSTDEPPLDSAMSCKSEPFNPDALIPLGIEWMIDEDMAAAESIVALMRTETDKHRILPSAVAILLAQCYAKIRERASEIETCLRWQLKCQCMSDRYAQMEGDVNYASVQALLPMDDPKRMVLMPQEAFHGKIDSDKSAADERSERIEKALRRLLANPSYGPAETEEEFVNNHKAVEEAEEALKMWYEKEESECPNDTTG